MIGRSYRRLQKMRRACYERSLRSELSAWQPAISRMIPILIFPLLSKYGINRSINCDRKTAGVHSCLESRRKRNVLDEIVSSARTSVLVLAALLAASLQLSHGAETRTLIDRPDPDSRPTQVSVDIFFVDINSIDSAQQTFTADIAVVLRWKDTRLAHTGSGVVHYPLDQVWNPRVVIVNETNSVNRRLPESVYVDADGTVLYRQRYVGAFAQPLRLHSFPSTNKLFVCSSSLLD